MAYQHYGFICFKTLLCACSLSSFQSLSEQTWYLFLRDSKIHCAICRRLFTNLSKKKTVIDSFVSFETWTILKKSIDSAFFISRNSFLVFALSKMSFLSKKNLKLFLKRQEWHNFLSSRLIESSFFGQFCPLDVNWPQLNGQKMLYSLKAVKKVDVTKT